MRKAFTIVLAAIAMIIAMARPQTAWGQGSSATMQYSGSTTTNMTGDNDAALVGLDASHWSVIGNKGGNSNFPGLNKSGQIRLYGASANHNNIVVTNTDNATITSINVTYGASNFNAKVTVGGAEVTGTGTDSEKEYAINNASFTITHNYSNNTQVYILSIVINYTSGGGVERVATPVITPESCTFLTSQQVSIACATTGATIHYTTNNWTTESTYTAPFTVTETTTVKAKATKNGMDDSYETAATYTKASSVLTTIDEMFTACETTGQYMVSFNNYVVSGVKGNNAYVTDGTKGFIIYKSGHGFNVGDILSGIVEVTLTKYQGSAEITDLTATTAGLTVTTGGSLTPQTLPMGELAGYNTGSLLTYTNLYYNGSFLVDEEGTAIKPYNQLYTGMSFSSGSTYNVTGVFLYYAGNTNPREIMPRSANDIVLATDVVATPSFTPAAGTYNGPQSITISSTTPGCTIYYTTNGAAPTTSSTVYTSPITISQNTTIKAFAAKSGCTSSEVATASYVIKQSHSISYNASANGSVTGVSSAYEGQTVQLTVTPSSGYALQSLTVCKTGDSSTTVDVFNNSFTMPSFNVTVNATFAAGTLVARYVKVTSDLDDWTGNYLIVYESDTVNVAFDGSLEVLDANFNNIPVSIQENAIEADATTNASRFNISKQNDKYAIQSASGLYIGPKKNDGTELKTYDTAAYIHTLSIVENSASIKSNKNTVLRFNLSSSSRRFRYYNNTQQKVQLYRYEETFVPTQVTVTATFNGNGGTCSDGTSYTQLIPENQATALTANRFTREGFSFNGWNTQANGSGTAYVDEQEVTLTENLTLFAQWKAKHTITLAAVQHGSISASPSSAAAGEVITLTATPSTGYVLSQWTVTDAGGQPVAVINNQFTMPDANVTVSATFVEGTTVMQYVLVKQEPLDWSGNYLIVYSDKAMDGRRSIDAIDQTKNIINVVVEDDVIESVDSIRNASFDIAKVDERYTIQSFANHYYIGNTQNKANIETSETPTMTHSISFGSGNTVTIQGDDERDLRYNNSSTVFRYYSSSQKAIQLYRYEATVVHAPCIVTFNGNGGSCTDGTSYTQSIVYNKATALTDNRFERENYYFAGWNTAANGSGTSFTDGQTVTITEALTLYAQWQAIPTITIATVAHGSITADKSVAMPGEIVTLTATADADFFFSHWIVTYGDNQTVPVSNNQFTMPEADVLVSAVFAEGYHTNAYVKVTSNLDDWSGNYLIVYEADSVAFDGSRDKTNLDEPNNTIDVFIFNGVIDYNDLTNASSFNIAAASNGEYTLQASSGYFIGPKTNGKDMAITQSNPIHHVLSINEEHSADINAVIPEITNSNLRFNNTNSQNRFRYYTSDQQAIQLYRYEATTIPMPNFITFNGNGGISSEGDVYTQPVRSNVPTPLSTNRFEFEGHHFMGWNTEADGTGTTYGENQLVTLSGDLQLYAQWQTMLSITIGTVQNGFIGADMNYAMPGDLVTLEASGDAGYVLSEWNVTYGDNQNVFVFHNQFIMPDANVTVNATFVKGTLRKQYVLVTETPDNWSGNYLIVNTADSVAFNGFLENLDADKNNIEVTIEDGIIEYNDLTSVSSFNIINYSDGSCTIQSASGYYIGSTSDNNGIATSKTIAYTNSILLENDSAQIVSSEGTHLRYNDSYGNHWFRYYKSSTYIRQKPVQLYRYTETVVTETETTAEIALQTGWNWFSMPVEADPTTSLQQLTEALGGQAKIIKSQNSFITYEDGEWVGSLTEINNEESYMIQVVSNTTITLTGATLQSDSHPITLSKGWNWIGYTLNETMSLTEALSGLAPHEGDVIKSKTQFCTFTDGVWTGSLEEIEPGTGLMYKSNSDNAVIFNWNNNQ